MLRAVHLGPVYDIADIFAVLRVSCALYLTHGSSLSTETTKIWIISFSYFSILTNALDAFIFQINHAYGLSVNFE